MTEALPEGCTVTDSVERPSLASLAKTEQATKATKTQTKLRAFRRHNQIAQERDFESTCKSKRFDCGNDRLFCNG